MPSSDGYKNLKGNGFDKHPERINKKGRPPSLKGALRKLLDKKGDITFKKKDIIKTDKEGNVTVSVPQREALMMRLIQVAMGRTSNNVRAIQMVMEHLEGKPTQLFEFMEYENVPTIFINATDHIEIDDSEE